MGQTSSCGKCEQIEVKKAEIYPLKTVKCYTSILEGTGPGKINCQDTTCIMEHIEEECHFFAIYDGFGPSGREASLAANQYIKTCIEVNSTKLRMFEDETQVEEFFKETFEGAENKMKSLSTYGEDANNSGTCCCCVFIKKNKCYISNLGNSRVVLCRVTSLGMVQTIDLSADHKPGLKLEKYRIYKAGGKVRRLVRNGIKIGTERFWVDKYGPGLTTSRALGAFRAKSKGLSAEPEIEQIDLFQNDRFLVIASDGLWDVMKTAEVIEFILEQEENHLIAEKLVNEAKRRWELLNVAQGKENFMGIGDDPHMNFGYDDISAIVIYLTFFTREEIEALKSQFRKTVSE
jgi:Serine/threonine protein phosphatase